MLCSGARARVLRRPWTDGRLRMGERAAAVGSGLAVSFLRRSSSGSFQMLCRDSVSLRFTRGGPHMHWSRVATRSSGALWSGRTYGRPMAAEGLPLWSRRWCGLRDRDERGEGVEEWRGGGWWSGRRSRSCRLKRRWRRVAQRQGWMTRQTCRLDDAARDRSRDRHFSNLKLPTFLEFHAPSYM